MGLDWEGPLLVKVKESAKFTQSPFLTCEQKKNTSREGLSVVIVSRGPRVLSSPFLKEKFTTLLPVLFRFGGQYVCCANLGLSMTQYGTR